MAAVILLGVAGFVLWPVFFNRLAALSETSTLQGARSINLLLYEYSVDNDGIYPSGANSTEVFQKLLDEKYADDPQLFYLPLPGKVSPGTDKLTPENVCWDVTSVVSEKDSNFIPIVFNTGYKVNYVPDGDAVPLDASSVVMQGLTVAYKSNTAAFVKDDGLPDHIVKNVLQASFDPQGKTYQQLTPTGPLKP